MRFTVLALDYDGTIARDGVLDGDARRAIAEVRSQGITVLIVTGRILDDLRHAAGDLRFVDAIVAENGAVIAFPKSGRSTVLAAPASPVLTDDLRASGVPFQIGECVVETDATFASRIVDSIRRVELPYALVFNRGRAMVLPTGVNKASGLREALRTLRLSLHNAIAIGDAENDHDLLEACEFGVAVAWGSPALARTADTVLDGAGPEAVAPFIRRAALDTRIAPERVGRRRLTLGADSDGRPFSLSVRGRNVLIVGDPKSGKSWVAGLICEHLIQHRYSVCVIDPEGDYSGLSALPGVIVLGGSTTGPTPAALRSALRYPDVNVVIDLAQMPHLEKWSYIRSLLTGLTETRRRFGVPHRIVLDEAHYLLHEDSASQLLDTQLAGYTLVTYQPSRLNPDVRQVSEAVIATRLTDPAELDVLAMACADPEQCRSLLAGMEIGQAAILPATEEARGALRVIQLAPRLTPHVRHREKYLDVPVPEERAFVFTANGKEIERAHTLREFVATIVSRPIDVLDEHLQRGDFSRWVREVYGDVTTANQIKTLEERYRAGRLADVNDAIASVVQQRYDVGPDAES